MCANFEPVIQRERLKQYFDVDSTEACPSETWPLQPCHFIRRNAEVPAGKELRTGLYGLIPAWAKDVQAGRHTYNARSETVAELPSFKQAWSRAQHCVVPMEALYEPNWETGSAVRWRIARTDQTPMGVAGLWGTWRTPDQRWLLSVTLLTINADGHSLMQRFHRPEDEKRMVVILQPQDYDAWLHATPENARDFLHRCDAQMLTAAPAPLERKARSGQPKVVASAPDVQQSLF